MVELDKRFSTPSQNSNRRYSISHNSESERSTNCIINRALIYSVYAYSVRWLDLCEVEQTQYIEMPSRLTRLKEELSEILWNQARKQIYEVLSRPSYRSILALYLFAIVPSSPRKTADNFEDHCVEASLSQHKYLNSRRAQIPFGHADRC